MKELALNNIKRASDAGSIQKAVTILSAARYVGFRIKTAEPNVIYYWSEQYGLSGSISF
jgi:hypothetical protein